MELYAQNAPMLKTILEKAFTSQSHFPAPNFTYSNFGPGNAYVFSADLDKLGSNVFAKTPVGGKVKLTVDVGFNEKITLELTKVKSKGNQAGANWRVACDD